MRQLRANRLRQLRDVPSALADRAFAPLLYGDHPYGHLAIGTEDGAAADRGRPGARLPPAGVPAGGRHADRGRRRRARRARRCRGRRVRRLGWPRPATRRFTPRCSARSSCRRSRRVTWPSSIAPGAAQSELRIGHVAVPRSTPDYPALLLLNMVLGGQFVSRINMNLREDKGYTYGARTAFDFRRGPGPFQLQASVQTGATAAAIEEVLEGDRGHRHVAAGVGARRWRWRARRSRADTRATSKPPSRSRGPSRSSRCTACRMTTSSASCRPSPALELDDARARSPPRTSIPRASWRSSSAIGRHRPDARNAAVRDPAVVSPV